MCFYLLGPIKDVLHILMSFAIIHIHLELRLFSLFPFRFPFPFPPFPLFFLFPLFFFPSLLSSPPLSFRVQHPLASSPSFQASTRFAEGALLIFPPHRTSPGIVKQRELDFFIYLLYNSFNLLRPLNRERALYVHRPHRHHVVLHRRGRRRPRGQRSSCCRIKLRRSHRPVN